MLNDNVYGGNFTIDNILNDYTLSVVANLSGHDSFSKFQRADIDAYQNGLILLNFAINNKYFLAKYQTRVAQCAFAFQLVEQLSSIEEEEDVKLQSIWTICAFGYIYNEWLNHLSHFNKRFKHMFNSMCWPEYVQKSSFMKINNEELLRDLEDILYDLSSINTYFISTGVELSYVYAD